MGGVAHQMHNVTTSDDIVDVVWDGDALNIMPGSDIDLISWDPNGNAGDGQEVVIRNRSFTNTVTIRHDSNGGTAGMRFYFADGLDHQLGPRQMVWGVRWEDQNETQPGWHLMF